MDPKLTKEERKMQEELLRHEFPFDEKAWASMEALLDKGKKKPGAGIPMEPVESIPGPSRNWGLLLLLLISAGLGAASLAWWNVKQTSNTLSSAQFKNEPSNSKTNSTAPELSDETKNKAERIEKGANPGPIPSSQAFSKLENTSGNPADVSSAIPASQQAMKTTGVEQEQTPEPTLETPLEQQRFWDLINLFIYPPRPVTSDAQKLQLDSIIHPVKRESFAKKRWERGWILGANANAVDYNPLRLSVLPHLGYFANYRIRPNTVLQAELVAKYVSGYKLHASFMDIIPTGSSQVILNTNNLLYLELPLIYKQQYKPGKSWLLGIKPSGNVKLFSSGLTSYSNFAPLRDEDSQNGIRYFDLGLVFGWEWRYSKNWALDIRYNQGLLDLTYDQFYRDQKTHLNSDLQVSLRYSIHPNARRHAPKTLFPTPAGK